MTTIIKRGKIPKRYKKDLDAVLSIKKSKQKRTLK